VVNQVIAVTANVYIYKVLLFFGAGTKKSEAFCVKTGILALFIIIEKGINSNISICQNFAHFICNSKLHSTNFKLILNDNIKLFSLLIYELIFGLLNLTLIDQFLNNFCRR
jgi:hypothetical protein